MDSATTHEQTMPPHRQFGFVYGILLFYGCQEPPQNVTIPLSPHHNLLPLLCHLPSRQRRQTRFCKGSLAFCPRQPPPFGCFRHTDWRLIFPLHASAAIFCCFYSKCTETALADSHAFTVEAGFSFSLIYELIFVHFVYDFTNLLYSYVRFLAKFFYFFYAKYTKPCFCKMGNPILCILYKKWEDFHIKCRNYN